DAQLASDSCELLNSCWPVDVRGDEKGLSSLLSQVEGQLPGSGRLPRTLKPEEHHRHGRRTRHIEGLLRLAQEFAHLVIDNLDELLARGDARHHLFP